MSNWGRSDFRQLGQLQEQLDRMRSGDMDKFVRACAKELAARLLGKVIRRTPVGNPDNWKTQYPPKGYHGGTLKRGWTAKTEREAELNATFNGHSSVQKFVEGMQVQKAGNVYTIEIINPVSYASYIEYGHRKSNHSGWVPGKFMLTISENELDAQKERILERKITEYLRGLFE